MSNRDDAQTSINVSALHESQGNIIVMRSKSSSFNPYLLQERFHLWLQEKPELIGRIAQVVPITEDGNTISLTIILKPLA